MAVDESPFSLYVHIPFCTAKCTYCDFNSFAGQDSLMRPYAHAVVAEAALWAAVMRGRLVETVFFGGGTPSLLPLEHMATIVSGIKSSFNLAPGAEMTLEANPGTVDAAHLAGLYRLGFNRLSFGVQSFHDDELLQLERIHGRREVAEAYDWAREAGFENVNLDLIFGLAGQTIERWQENLEAAIEMAPEHLSLYALTLEEGTPLTRDVGRGRAEAPDPDLQADMYEWTCERLATTGYKQYEISNWARPGRECRHNLVYWHNGDWLGLGAGAHSHLFDERFADVANPRRYIELVGESRGPNPGNVGEAFRPPVSGAPAMRQTTFCEPPDRSREMSETVILALRLREGLDLAAFACRFGVAVEEVFGPAIEETRALGLTEIVGGRLRLRDEAVLVGDEAMLRFLPNQDEP
jgi:putative oxygen-independent coproporphyrinogen III oxidase